MLKPIVFLFAGSLSIAAFAQNPGTLNPDFNAVGWDSLYGNNNGLETHKVLIQPDGKIVFCSEANFSNEGHQAVVVRYNPDGTLDNSFGGDGVVRTQEDLDPDMYTRAYGFALQSDGKMIIAGDQFYNTERIIRLNTDGTLDTSFGDNGVVDFNRPNSEYIYHANVQSDDKILITGRGSWMVDGVAEKHVFIWRLLSDGTLDTSFGDNGQYKFASSSWTTGFENYLVVNDVIVRENDKILINTSFTGLSGEFVLIKQLTPDGSPDNSFGTNSEWLRTNSPASGNYTYSAMCLLEDQSLLCASTPYDTDNFSASIALHKLNAEGVEDLSFQPILWEGLVSGFSLRLKSFGNVFYAHIDNVIDNTIKEIRCYNLAGNLVPEFGANGIALLNENLIPPLGNAQFDVGADGQIYLAAAEIGGKSNLNNLVIANVVGMPYESISQITTPQKPLWRVFPCPAEQFIILENIELNSSFTILNESGQIVKTIKRATSSTMLVDVSSLAAGTYFIYETTTNATQQFVVLAH